MYATSTVFGAAVAALTLFTASPVSAGVAAPARGPWAGSVDMEQACKQQYGNDWTAVSGSNAYDWKCSRPSTGQTATIDVNGYCSHNYHNNAYADPQGGGKYDWGCYFP